MSCSSGPRHRMFGAVLPSFLFSICATPLHGKRTEFPSGTITSEGSMVNFSAEKSEKITVLSNGFEIIFSKRGLCKEIFLRNLYRFTRVAFEDPS